MELLICSTTHENNGQNSNFPIKHICSKSIKRQPTKSINGFHTIHVYYLSIRNGISNLTKKTRKRMREEVIIYLKSGRSENSNFIFSVINIQVNERENKEKFNFPQQKYDIKTNTYSNCLLFNDLFFSFSMSNLRGFSLSWWEFCCRKMTKIRQQ